MTTWRRQLADGFHNMEEAGLMIEPTSGNQDPGAPAGQGGQPQPGQQYPAYGQQPSATGPPPQTNTSALVLTIVSGVVMFSSCFLIGIPSLIFGIMALTSSSADPLGSRKKSRTGWILFAANVGVILLVGVMAAVLFRTSGASSVAIDSGV